MAEKRDLLVQFDWAIRRMFQQQDNDMLSTARREGYYEGLEVGRAEARAIEAEYAEGREIGRLQEKQSIVRKLKAMGVDPELISQASGMSLEEIDQL